MTLESLFPKPQTAMKKSLSLLLSILLTLSSFAQTETPALKTVASNFEKHFNAGEYEAIFNEFSPQMQTALPLEKIKEVMTGLTAQLGKITGREFTGFEQGFAIYKTQFEKGIMAVRISVDDQAKINGLFFSPYVADNTPTPERNTTKLILPFRDEWTVIWGGDTKKQNYHIENEAQKNAFDLVITDEKGKSYRTNGFANEDYFAFGKELLAPCDAEVVLVVDGIKDNKPGELNRLYVPGNTVVLKTKNNEYLFFAHFKQHSIVVKAGDKVKQGQLLGLCGNSGNSSEPHIHFHIQNREDMQKAKGIKCYFERLLVNGEVKEDYSPVQGERIKP